MTPYEISHRQAAIMLKHGEPGRIQIRPKDLDWNWIKSTDPDWNWINSTDPDWNWVNNNYRWVGPGKRVELKRGMEVKTDIHLYLVVNDESAGKVTLSTSESSEKSSVEYITHYRWPNSEDQTWLPVVQEEVLEV